jgi:hypothetical protein
MNKRILTATLTAIATFTLIRKLTGFSGTNVKLPGIPVIRKGIRKLSETNENRENKPKFKLDQPVRIAGLIPVYQIIECKIAGGNYVYRLEGMPDTSFYAEDVLEPASDDDVEFAVEHATGGEYIIPLFDVGDTVQIDGTPEVYRIVGAFPEMIYALQDVQTNEIIDMDECVLKAFDGDVIKEYDENDINALYNRLEAEKMAKEPKEERKLSAREESSREAERRKQARKQKAADIDNLLDIANWNRKQFEATGEEAFAEKEREQYAKIEDLNEK